MRGQWTHRRVGSFGLDYDGRRGNLTPTSPIPEAFAGLQQVLLCRSGACNCSFVA